MTAIQERAADPATELPVAPPGAARTALTLGAFVALGPLTIDMYLPALPSMTRDLGTTAATAQLTLTGTLIGLALGQLVLGPLSDAYGRRRPLLAGTALHVLASLLVLVAPTVAVLGALRVLQGVGAAAGAVIALAVVRDLYDGRAAATMLSRLFLVLGAAPVLAPTIGGEILRFTSWRGVFALLAAYGLALLAVGWATLARRCRRSAAAARASSGRCAATASCCTTAAYVGLVLVAGLTMAGLFSYVSGSAFVYQGEFGLDEQQFGLLFGAGAFWLIAATQLNPLVLRRFEPQQVLVAGTVVGALAGAALVVLAAHGHRRAARRRRLAVGRALRLRAGAAERSGARPLPPRRGGRHRRRAAGRRPVRRRRPRLAGRRPARQRRGRHRRRRGVGAGARARRPGRRRAALAAERARRSGLPRHPCTEPAGPVARNRLAGANRLGRVTMGVT